MTTTSPTTPIVAEEFTVSAAANSYGRRNNASSLQDTRSQQHTEERMGSLPPLRQAPLQSSSQRVIRILVTGSRYWPDGPETQNMIELAVRTWMGPRWHTDDAVIIEGGAEGLDRNASLFAHEAGLFSEAWTADWITHGRAAGPIRNQAMVDSGADACLGFPLGESRGTLDCMTRAHRASIPVWRCGPDGIQPWTP